MIHAITPKRFEIGDEVRTRCGKPANVNSVGVGATWMIDIAGNDFYGSTHTEAVTCKKCINLLTVGTIHAKARSPSRAANTQKRALARGNPAAASVAGSHRNPIGRPRGGRLRPIAG